jgi:hypothetical protein
MFSGRESTHQPARVMSFLPSTIQTILSALELHQIMRLRARGLYHRSGIHLHIFMAQMSPCPEGYYFVL